MRSRPTWSVRLAVTFGFAAMAALCFGHQFPVPQDPITPPFGGDATLSFAGVGGMSRPNLPPQGDWAEVIMSNNKWLVLQNDEGQQFPVSYETVKQFFVRWPATVDQASPNTLVEVTGVDLGSNQLRTDHIDLYENEARTLVSPTFLRLAGYDRVYSAFDVDMEQTYGIYFPMMPSEYLVPRRLHVVGPIIDQSPLRLAIAGNNAVAVVPSPTGVTVTQVTLGVPNLVQKGDLAYFVPSTAGVKSLGVSQLVLYKKMPYRAFIR